MAVNASVILPALFPCALLTLTTCPVPAAPFAITTRLLTTTGAAASKVKRWPTVAFPDDIGFTKRTSTRVPAGRLVTAATAGAAKLNARNETIIELINTRIDPPQYHDMHCMIRSPLMQPAERVQFTLFR